MVRARLPKKLRTQFDSLDFVQAVWQSFFAVRPLDSPDFAKVEHLRGFLAGVVRNKVFEQHRRLTKTEKYDGRANGFTCAAGTATCRVKSWRRVHRRARQPRPVTEWRN